MYGTLITQYHYHNTLFACLGQLEKQIKDIVEYLQSEEIWCKLLWNHEF